MTARRNILKGGAAAIVAAGVGSVRAAMPTNPSLADVVIVGGADSALGWRGFIDGAIESGYRGAREIDRYLMA